MKAFKTGLVIALSIVTISVSVMPKKLYSADMDKSAANIQKNTITEGIVKTAAREDQDKIDLEREAILADGRKLQEAKKTGDKARIEQVRQEVTRDIAKRKAAIRSLKDDMHAREGNTSELGPGTRHGRGKK